MKTLTFSSLCLALTIYATLHSQLSYSRIVNVNATADNVFIPASVKVNVNDTIQWTRTGGDHTTTCDGSPFTSRPPGALPWNAPLDNSNPTFRYVVRVQGVYNYICIPHAPGMAGFIEATPSSVIQINEQAGTYDLSQNFPNPFNPVTKINFTIPMSSAVSLKVYNSMAQEVATLVNERLKAGTYEVDWPAYSGEDQSRFTSGVYYYKIEAGDFIETKKMILVK